MDDYSRNYSRDYSRSYPDYSSNDYNQTDIGEYTKANIQIMLIIMLFVSCASPLIHLFNICKIRCREKYYNYRLKIYRVNSNDNLLLDECSICLEKYKVNDKIMNLKCRHSFHKDCINIWLKDNNTCPQCRENII